MEELKKGGKTNKKTFQSEWWIIKYYSFLVLFSFLEKGTEKKNQKE